MPEFILNARNPRKGVHPFYSLNPFARGYIEAMFFTNADCGDDNEDSLNGIGVERLTRDSVANIARDCAQFESDNAALLELAYARDYDESQAGRDFWFTRQGHGVGFWDRRELEPDSVEYERLTNIMVENRDNRDAWGEALAKRDVIKAGSLGERLSKAARAFGESYCEIYRGWIHYR